MKTIGAILENNKSSLGKLLAKCQVNHSLATLFTSVIDSSLAKYCKVANYHRGELTLVVANAAWATKVRYAVPDIIKTLRTQPEFKDIKKIYYSVVNQRTSKISKLNQPRQRPALSKENEFFWRKTMEQLKDSQKTS